MISIEEKAKIEFDEYISYKTRIWTKLSEEERKIIEEDRRQHPKEEMTLGKFREQFREAHSLIEQLRDSKYFQNRNGVDIYNIFVDTMRNPEHNFHPDGFVNSRIVNLKDNPELLWFLNITLCRYFFKELNFRCVSNKRLEYVLNNGTDREDKKTYVSRHPAKALEYGFMPKLLLVYDAKGIEYTGGIEKYEHRLIIDPKSVLECVIWVHKK